jgi:radical SAM protein with 4Fe4S-binding SPASM domain
MNPPEPQLPRYFILELTRNCNNRCRYCYTSWNAPDLYRDPGNAADMSTAEIKDLIARLHEEVPFEVLGISGGEPWTRPDLPELLRFVSRRGITPIVITNGTLITPELAKGVAEVQSLYQITLLSHRREVHDYLAGRRGARDQALAGITNLRTCGIKPVVVFVATKQNYMDLSKTAELALAFGATAFSYNRINLGACNIRLADELLPTPDMLRENLETLEALKLKYGVPIAISVVIEPCIVDTRKFPSLQLGGCPLAGEGSYFTIDPAGNLRVCNHSPTILGNLRKEHFTDIYYHHPYVQRFREVWPDECRDCDAELKAICHGGCRAAAEQCYGTLQHVDPFVTLSRTTVNSRV